MRGCRRLLAAVARLGSRYKSSTFFRLDDQSFAPKRLTGLSNHKTHAFCSGCLTLSSDGIATTSLWSPFCAILWCVLTSSLLVQKKTAHSPLRTAATRPTRPHSRCFPYPALRPALPLRRLTRAAVAFPANLQWPARAATEISIQNCWVKSFVQHKSRPPVQDRASAYCIPYGASPYGTPHGNPKKSFFSGIGVAPLVPRGDRVPYGHDLVFSVGERKKLSPIWDFFVFPCGVPYGASPYGIQYALRPANMVSTSTQKRMSFCQNLQIPLVSTLWLVV